MVGDARGPGLATLVVAGRCTEEGAALARDAGCDVVSLVDRFGPVRAEGETVRCVARVTADWLGPADHGA